MTLLERNFYRQFTGITYLLLGDQASGLSENTVSRLKAKWLAEHSEWRQQDLTQKRYVYWWAGGIYSNVRMDDKLCLLMIIVGGMNA